MLDIHKEEVHLDRNKKLLLNNGPNQPISILCASIKHIRCSPVTKLLYPIFIRVSICLSPCVP